MRFFFDQAAINAVIIHNLIASNSCLTRINFLKTLALSLVRLLERRVLIPTWQKHIRTSILQILDRPNKSVTVDLYWQIREAETLSFLSF